MGLSKRMGHLLKGTKATALLTAAGGLIVGTYSLITYVVSKNKDSEQLIATGISYATTLGSLGLLWRIIKLERESLEDQLGQDVGLDQYGHVDRPHY